MIHKIQIILLRLLSGLAAAVCLAQVQNGAITGTLTDSTGAVLPHVSVSALNVATGTHYIATSTSSGTIGRITSLAGDPRVMQFALKLYF